jgi:SAM-dependent methyltransferase
MLSWYRTQVKAHGLVPATLLLSRVVRYRIPVVVSNRLLPDKLECPCCGWKGRRFLDYVELGYRIPNAACPNCDSHSRHRAFYLWLKNDFHLEKKSGRALIFAPERSLMSVWQSAPNLRTFKVDIEAARGVDLLADVMRLPVANGSFDLIWCHHVLEQVADDRAALRELHRVLTTSGGDLVVSVGLTQETTLEFGYANDMFSGNRRLYGSDFARRLEDAGFVVKPITYELAAEDAKRYVVSPETFYHCTRSDEITEAGF